jgi:hypothetical protein
MMRRMVRIYRKEGSGFNSCHMERVSETYDPVEPRNTLDTVEDTAVSVSESVAVQSTTETLGQSGNSRHPAVRLTRVSFASRRLKLSERCEAHMKIHERKMMIAWEAIEKRKDPVALRKPEREKLVNFPPSFLGFVGMGYLPTR